MTYQITNPRAAHSPLKSVSMFRPVAALGPAFAAHQRPRPHPGPVGSSSRGNDLSDGSIDLMHSLLRDVAGVEARGLDADALPTGAGR